MRYLISLIIIILPVNTFAHAGEHTNIKLGHFTASLFHLFPAIAVIAIVTYLIAKKIYSKK